MLYFFKIYATQWGTAPLVSMGSIAINKAPIASSPAEIYTGNRTLKSKRYQVNIGAKHPISLPKEAANPTADPLIPVGKTSGVYESFTAYMQFWKNPAKHVNNNCWELVLQSVNSARHTATNIVDNDIIDRRPKIDSHAYIASGGPGIEKSETIR